MATVFLSHQLGNEHNNIGTVQQCLELGTAQKRRERQEGHRVGAEAQTKGRRLRELLWGGGEPPIGHQQQTQH